MSKLIAPWAHPNGLLGHLAGWEMARGKAAANRSVLDALDPGPADRILEIGFGPGVTIAHLAQFTEATFAGVDPSPVMLAQAARRNAAAIAAGRVDLRLAPAERLPFTDDEFDRALTLNSIVHWDRRRDGLAEVRRTLKPGGVLVVGLRGAGAVEGVTGDLVAGGFTVERVVGTLLVAR